MLTYLLFILGFPALIKGADLLVDGACAIAEKFKVSHLVIGLTIVSFGTSAPELAVNIFSALSGNTDLAIGNVLGSNIANIFLILGISAMVYPLVSKGGTVWKEIPLSLLAAISVGVLANDAFFDGLNYNAITRSDGLVLIFFLVIFIYYIFGIAKKTDDFVQNPSDFKKLNLKQAIFGIVFGLVGLVLGGKWIVDGAVKIAQIFNLSQAVIGLTVVAIGTSLPELATSVVAARKKQSDIVIGNAVGSNIFNVFWILGVSAIIRPLPFEIRNNPSVIVAILASLFLFLAMFTGGKKTLDRKEGAFFVMVYVAYLVFLVVSAV